jgi:hypothetical protein
MKRYHDEKHIIENRAKRYRQLNAGWLLSATVTRGRFRKSARCAGCGLARCQLCHPEKYPKRKPTRKEQQARQDEREEG